MIYQYLLLTSKQEVAKWGTFVEGIFDTTSFLPYLRNDDQSRFYQWLLYKTCLSYDIEGHKITFEDYMCHVSTPDYQQYFVSLNSWHTRSDGVPVSLDDIFFTYNDILTHNDRDIPHLAQYEKVIVSNTDNGKIQITFPTASTDNTLFFTNYILPRHALFDIDLKTYQKLFAIEPVYNQCARIMPQSTDQYSLVFDLSACKDSHLGFYQIKNTNSFDQFAEAVNTHWSIIDAYTHPVQLSWYVQKNLLSNKYITLFFNTKSRKTSVRLRRSLAWLISYNFYQTGYEKIIDKYDEDLFSNFLSTWARVKEFLWRVDSTEALSKWDLEDIGVTKLLKTLTISWTDKKLVYFVENIKNIFTLELKFDTAYDKIKIHHNNDAWYVPKSYNKKTKSGKYNIGSKLNNLKPGINKYTIYGFKWTKKNTIATIDLYNLKWWTLTQDDIGGEQVQENLSIIYYNDKTSISIIDHLKKIFEEQDILDYFDFVKVESVEELEWKLLAWDYDIILNSINMWFKKDISKVLSSEKVQINHSQYKNPRLVSLIQQYLQAKDKQKSSIAKQVNEIYAKDMPFIMLWTSYEPLFIKKTTLAKFINTGTKLHQENRRQEIYKNLQLVQNINIDVDNAWDFKKFREFLKYGLKGSW